MAIHAAQRSEVHETTGDASAAPAAGGDEQATRDFPGRTEASDRVPTLPLEVPIDVRVVRDDTDAGGPLVIESGDPDLNPPRTPKDPFPTDRTPEVDPPLRGRGRE